MMSNADVIVIGVKVRTRVATNLMEAAQRPISRVAATFKIAAGINL